MGEEAYHKAQEELWDDFDARSRAYSDAVKALRGEGVDKTMTPALLGYSTRTVSKLLGGEEAANVVYSPANLYLALSMLTETVDGETRAQLLDLLGAEDEETVRTTANAIWRSLYTDSANSKTLLANSLWLSEGQVYKTETVERLANDYYASVFSAPMGTGDTNKAVQAWLNTNTGGLLADAAKNIETKPQTVMLLLSTLYFKDRWSDEFYDGATSEDTFTAADGTRQTADLLWSKESVYLSDDNTTGFMKYYDGGRYAFVALLPSEGVSIADYVAGLTGGKLHALLNEHRYGTVEAAIPRFTASSSLELNDALKAMGVTDAFDASRADLRAMGGAPNDQLYVSGVLHKTYLSLDENGTKAAAVTAVVTDTASAEPPQVYRVVLDRPFVYMIVDTHANLPLFLGTVTQMNG